MHETHPVDTSSHWKFFDVSEDECSVIVHGDRRYFLLRVGEDRRAFVADACPHRGGPLHMGSWDASCSKIRCPWHKHSWGLDALRVRTLPGIRRGRRWSVVLPDARARPYPLKRRVVSPDHQSARWGVP
jgi:nitrite reductase (NADH) small subunit